MIQCVTSWLTIMRISRSAVLLGHMLTSIISNAISIIVIIAVALLMGFRSSASIGEWLGVAGILLLFISALTWLAAIPGLKAKTIDGASVFAYPLIFLPFISSAFVPTDTMPTPVRIFAENQPVTAIVDAIRSLLSSASLGSEIWIALAWRAGITTVAYFIAVRAYRRIA